MPAVREPGAAAREAREAEGLMLARAMASSRGQAYGVMLGFMTKPAWLRWRQWYWARGQGSALPGKRWWYEAVQTVAGPVVGEEQWDRNWESQPSLVGLMARFRAKGMLLGLHDASDAKVLSRLHLEWQQCEQRERARRRSVQEAESAAKRAKADERRRERAGRGISTIIRRARTIEARGEQRGLLTLARQARQQSKRESHRVGRILANLRTGPRAGPRAARAQSSPDPGLGYRVGGRGPKLPRLREPEPDAHD